MFLQTIEARDADLSGFENLGEDSSLEISLRDWTFACWHAAFAKSPAPSIVLDWDGRAWVLSPELMQKPAPGKDVFWSEFQAKLRTSPSLRPCKAGRKPHRGK